uniref:Chromodomain Y-like protein n=1 Tax=Lygus hesperus TaxID=30085 RepID=A0A146M7R9_LYGHE
MSCEGPVNVSTSSPETLEEKVDSDPPATILELVGEPIACAASEIVETAEISFVTSEDLKAVELSKEVDLPKAVLVESGALQLVETPEDVETVVEEELLLVAVEEPPRIGEPPTAVEPSISEKPPTAVESSISEKPLTAVEAVEPLEPVEPSLAAEPPKQSEPPVAAEVPVPDESPKIYETLKPAEPLAVAEAPKTASVAAELSKAVESPLKAAWASKAAELSKPPRCVTRAPRKAPYTSSLITQSDIAQEILARAEKKRQTFPDAVDVLVAMKSSSQIRIPTMTDPVPHTSPPKLPKLRDENTLDAKDLLLILQDGADGNEQKPKTAKSRNPRPKLDLKIDPDLERELALKQLMEFSKKTERKPRNSGSNNNVEGEQRVKRARIAKQDKPMRALKKDKNPKGVVKTIKPNNKQLKINKMLKTNRQEKNSKPEKNNRQEKSGKQDKSPVKSPIKQEKSIVKQEKLTKIKQEKDIKQEKVETKEEPVKPKKRASAASASNGPPAKRSNRELARLLQDEGAINMLYDIEKGNNPENKSRLSSKTRLKKVLKKKAQDVKEAILAATSTAGSHRSMRTSDKRKQSVDSVGPESSAEDPPQETISPTKPLPTFQEAFQQTAEASKIIRRHSSSSSYSSRGSSPRRMSVDRDRSPSSSETTPSKIDLLNLTATLAELHQESPSTEFLPQSAQASEFLPQSTPFVDSEAVPRSSPQPAASKATISERTEKLIEMKVRELNLQPHHGAIIKRLIVDKKNGLKERLQSEFAVKFKAALPHDNHTESTPKAPGVKLNMQALQLLKAKTQNLVSSLDTPPPATTSPSKPVWKSLVEEDWDSGDDDPDDPAPVKSIKVEEDRGFSKTMEQDISIIAENMLARLKAGVPITQLGSLLNKPSAKEGKTTTSSTSLNDRRTVPVEAAEIRLLRASSPPTESQIEELTSIPQSVDGPVPGSDVRLERMNAIIRLYIKPTTCRLPNSLNVKVMNELTQALTYLESSSDTRVIVLVFPPLHEAMAAISDSENDPDYREQPPDVCAGRISPAFRSGQHIVEVLPTDQVNHCNGIDLLSLCAESQDERRQAATQTATAIKDLTHKLATCSRLLCTAVSGKAIGLSVVLLAYCDFVLADETASFSTPYTQLGYLPEAAATHTLPHIIGRRKTSWLLLGNGTLTASEAEVCGLVTRVVLRRSHLAHELNTLARSLASTSLLASESAKGMMYHSIRSTISNLLSTEAKVLETHWSAPDTQHRMKNFAVQLILDMHKAQWKERESRVKDAEVEIIRSQAVSGQSEEFEVPSQQLVFEEPSDHLGIEPLQPVDELHFEDPTVELQMPTEDHEYELQQLR